MEKTKFTIRVAEPSDAFAVNVVKYKGWLDNYLSEEHGVTLDWIYGKWAERFGYEGVLPEYDFIKEHISSKDSLFLVAEDEKGMFAGFMFVRRNEKHQLLDSIYIYSDFQGSGLAQDFMKKFEAWEDKSRDSELGVVSYNKRAIRFYEKYGFNPNGVTYHIHEIIPCIDMVKKNVKEENK